MNKKRRRSSFRRIETIIIIVIAGCMIFLMDFTHNKLNEFARLEQEALLITHDPSNPVHNELAEEILEYRPEAYKMIEIYTKDFDIMMTLHFTEDKIAKSDLRDYPELMELFYTHEEGHTQLSIGDKKEDIYFRWTPGADGQKYLIIIYASRHPVKNLGVFDFVCYSVLLMVFLLLIILHISHYKDKVKQYQTMSEDVRNRLMH